MLADHVSGNGIEKGLINKKKIQLFIPLTETLLSVRMETQTHMHLLVHQKW